MLIVTYADGEHRSEVIELWKRCFGYQTAHNEPGLAIDRKLAVADGLFFVAIEQHQVIGTAMAGYDGHRGWIYSVAVHPEHRQMGTGTALLKHAEVELINRNCLKINLQIAEGNDAVVEFYEKNGYAVEPRISMGKKLFTGS